MQARLLERGQFAYKHVLIQGMRSFQQFVMTEGQGNHKIIDSPTSPTFAKEN